MDAPRASWHHAAVLHLALCLAVALVPAGALAAPLAATSGGKIQRVDLGRGFEGWSLELLPGRERAGSALHRIRVRDATGSLRQVIRHRSDLGSPHWLLNPLLEDLDFDGYLDLAVVREFGAKWGRWRVWRFDPRRGRLVESPLTRALGELPNLEVDRARREVRSSSVGPSDPWTRRYRVIAGRLRLVGEEVGSFPRRDGGGDHER